MSLFAFRKDISEIETYLKRVTSTNILVVIYLVNSQKYFGRNDNCVYEEIKVIYDHFKLMYIDNKGDYMFSHAFPNLSN